jgi:hypothetical protein
MSHQCQAKVSYLKGTLFESFILGGAIGKNVEKVHKDKIVMGLEHQGRPNC